MVECIEAPAEKEKIFLDTCGTLGIYTASSQVIDDMKHVTPALCTHYSFQHRTCEDGQKFAYTTKRIYRNCCVSIILGHTLELHSAVMTKEDTGYLGMKPGAVDGKRGLGRWPMVKLCNELKMASI